MAYLGVKPAAITSATEAEIAGDLTVDTNTLVVDAANNRVGIGASPDKSLDVNIASATMRIRDASGGNDFAVKTIAGPVSLAGSTVNTAIGFMTNDTERLRILAGGGLTFNGDTAAQNALNDYEEGSWTPTYGGSSSNPTVTLDFQTGSYVKIGKIVIASFTIGTDATSGGSGSLLVNGLPFPSMSGRDFISGPALAFSFSSTISDMAMGTSSNTTAIILYQNNNSASTYSTGMLATGANKNRLSGTVIYEVS